MLLQFSLTSSTLSVSVRNRNGRGSCLLGVQVCYAGLCYEVLNGNLHKLCVNTVRYRSRFCFLLLSNSESLSFLFGFCYDFMKINVHTIIPIICNHF